MDSSTIALGWFITALLWLFGYIVGRQMERRHWMMARKRRLHFDSRAYTQKGNNHNGED